MAGWLRLQPLDTVVFRDGRPFDAGTDSLARTIFPRPATVAGAAGAALNLRPETVAGPLLWTGERAWLPTPRDVVAAEPGEPERLQPTARAGIHDDLGGSAPSFALRGEGTSAGGWISSDDLAVYLAGAGADDLNIVPGEEFLQIERRVGLWREDGRTASDGFLYSAEHLRPRPRLGRDALSFIVDVRGEGLVIDRDVVRLGGEGHQSSVSWLDADAEVLPAAPAEFPQGRVLVYLATPAVFPDGWRPPLDAIAAACRADTGLELRLELAAACNEGPVAITGWDPAATPPGPRAARWAVEAGSVYLLSVMPPVAAPGFAAWAHGRCLPQADELLRTAGFGMCLIGRWPHT